MSIKVELYVYDLSNGLATTMGPMLIGRPLEGIWHTSIVVYGMEIFYGQGIAIVSPPGTTHHGRPRKILPMGNTNIDKETLMEYVEGLRAVYTAEKYHLLEYNCNTFTNEVVGFLTGGGIPQDILGLPALILSTPFGQQMRPMIDQMFRGRNVPSASQAVNNILPGVVAQAQQSPASPLSRAAPGAAATPTPVPSQPTSTAPPHPHAKLQLPALQSLSRNLAPVTYTAFPALPSLATKLDGFLSAASGLKPTTAPTLTKAVISYLAALPAPPAKLTSTLPPTLVQAWIDATNDALAHLPPAEWFPALDLWRLALARDGARLGANPAVPAFLSQTVKALSKERDGLDKPSILTAVRLVSNALAVPELVTALLNPVSGAKNQVAAIAVRALLDADEGVRSAGAGLAWSTVGRVWLAREGSERVESEEEWDVEVASAVVEAVGKEDKSVEVVHRLLATLGLLLYQSPHYDAVQGLLAVLDAADVLQQKKELVQDKPEVVGLLSEVVTLVEGV